MNSLTSREREIVLTLAAGGPSNKDVGRRLNLSEGTVKVHLHNIFRKLGIKNRTELVVLAHLDGLAHTGAAAESAAVSPPDMPTWLARSSGLAGTLGMWVIASAQNAALSAVELSACVL